MSDDIDWNEHLREQLQEQHRKKAEELRIAREAAVGTQKEQFNALRFRALYTRLNAADVDKYTPWDTLIREAEYDYYVSFPDKMTLEELIEHIKWLQGFG